MNSPDTFGDTTPPPEPQQKAVYDEIKALREGRAARIPYMAEIPIRDKDLRGVIQQGQRILSEEIDKVEMKDSNSKRNTFLNYLNAKLTRGQKIQEGLRKIAESGAPPPVLAASAEGFDKLEEEVNDRTEFMTELKQKISDFQDLDSAKNSDDIQLLMKNAFKNGELFIFGRSQGGKEFQLAKEDGTIDYKAISDLLESFFNYESAQINDYTTLTDSDRHAIDDAVDRLSALAVQNGVVKFHLSRPERLQNMTTDLYTPKIEEYRTVMQSIKDLLPYLEFINNGYRNYLNRLYDTFDIKQLPENDSGFIL